jgi:predicted membrane protein
MNFDDWWVRKDYQTKKKVLRIFAIIMLIPFLLFIGYISFVLIYSKQITEGAARLVGNKFVLPVVFIGTTAALLHKTKTNDTLISSKLNLDSLNSK